MDDTKITAKAKYSVKIAQEKTIAQEKCIWFWATMQPTVFCVLTVLKSIDSKQKTLKWNYIYYVWERNHKILQLVTWKETGFVRKVYDFSVNYNAKNFDWKNTILYTFMY